MGWGVIKNTLLPPPPAKISGAKSSPLAPTDYTHVYGHTTPLSRRIMPK